MTTFTTYKGIQITLAKHPECGWYIEASGGYVSEYYSTKKQAEAEKKRIKQDIKRGYW